MMLTQAPNDAVKPASAKTDFNLAPANRDTVVLQCLAALSIANSHLEAFYPQSWMAADGLLGNSMFFLLSGYGLMCSEQQHSRPFLQYYWRRILRIYPSLFLTMLIFPLWRYGTWRVWSVTDYIRHFIYPTGYEFIWQIMVFYIAFYFLSKLRQPRIFLWTATALILPYAWFWWTDVESGRTASLMLGKINTYIKWVYFFQTMLLGGWLAGGDLKRCLLKLRHPWLLLAGFFMAYVAIKYAMVKGVRTPLGLFFNFYSLLHLLTVVIILFAFGLTIGSAFLDVLRKIKPLYWIVSMIGGLTLEIYIVHDFVFRDPRVVHIVFPLNVIVFFVISICLSWVVAQMARVLRQPRKISERIAPLRKHAQP